MKSKAYKSFFYSTIVVLIIGMIFIFVSMPSKSMALGKTQYKVVKLSDFGAPAIQKTIDSFSSQGWELVTYEGSSAILIFKKQ